jgi:predicted PurR-regulated permease PerM
MMQTQDEAQAVTDRSRPVSIGWVASAVVVVLVAVTAGGFVLRLGDVAGLVITAAAIALITLPIRRRLAAVVGRGAATALTALATVAGVGVVATVALGDLSKRAEDIARLAERRLDEIDQGSLIDRVVSATRLDDAITGWLEEVPSEIVVGGDGGGALATRIFLFLTVVILAAFLQSSGERIVNWACGRWPREAVGPDGDTTSPRRTARELADDIERRGIGFVRRVIVVVLASAAIVAGVGSATGFPGAVVLGLWVGCWAVVPTVGFVAAMAPVAVLLALDQRPIGAVMVAVVVAVLVMAVVVRRRWLDPMVRVGAGPYVIAVAAGLAVGGVGGSLVALTVVAALVAITTSPHRVQRPTLWELPADRVIVWNGVTLPTGWRLGLLVVAAVAAGVGVWILAVELGRFVVWVVVGGFVAVALSRPVAFVEDRTRLSRSGAAGVVCGIIGVALIAAGLTGADEGARATTTLTERLPEIVADLEEFPVVGAWLEEREAAVWVEEQMNDLPQRVRTGRPADWLPYFGSRLVDLFWTLMIALALLVDGPRMARAAERRVPAVRRRQWSRLIAATGTALAGYAAGAALVASINATVIFVIAAILGLGVAPALALWGFVWAFVPQIGGFMGGFPLVVFAFVLGPAQGLFAAVVFIAYQFVENHVIQPSIIGAAIDIAPWGTLLAAVAGAAAAGVVGAVVLTPLVGVVGVIRRELASDDFPGVTASTARSDRPPVTE